MTIRDHLQAIYDQHGRLTPELVVQAARPKDHPLHAHVFDRAQKDAAEAWYRSRAHELIQSVTIVYREDPDGTKHRIRAFHATRTEQGHAYEPVERVASEPFLREMVLRDMEREWKQLQARYGNFTEFLEMVTQSIAA